MVNGITRTLDVERYLNSMKDTTFVSKGEIMGQLPSEWESVESNYLVTYTFHLAFQGESAEPLPTDLKYKIENGDFDRNGIDYTLIVTTSPPMDQNRSIGLIRVVITTKVRGTTFDVREGGVNLSERVAGVEEDNRAVMYNLTNTFTKYGADGAGVHILNFTRFINFEKRTDKTDVFFTDYAGNPEFTRQVTPGDDGSTLVADTYFDTKETTVYTLKYAEKEEYPWQIFGDSEQESFEKPTSEDRDVLETPTQQSFKLPEVEDFGYSPFEEEPLGQLETPQVFESKEEIVVDTQGNQYVVEHLYKNPTPTGFISPNLDDDRPLFDNPFVDTENPFLDSQIDYDTSNRPALAYAPKFEEVNVQQNKKPSFSQSINNVIKNIGRFFFRR